MLFRLLIIAGFTASGFTASGFTASGFTAGHPTEAPAPWMVTHPDGLIALIVTLPIITALGLYFICVKYNSKLSTKILLGVIIVGLLPWIYTAYFVGVYRDQIKVQYYERSTAETVNLTSVQTECAKLTQCQCTNVVEPAPTCTEAKNQLLQPLSLTWNLTCNNGYYCCKSKSVCVSYATHCSGTPLVCRTVCARFKSQCTHSVNNQNCLAVRGICTDLTAILVYNNTQQEPVTKEIKKSCGLNDTNCVEQFISVYGPIGRKNRIYYAPWNYDIIVFSVSYRNGVLVALILPCVLVLCVLIALVFNERQLMTSCATKTISLLNYGLLCSCFVTKSKDKHDTNHKYNYNYSLA